MAKRRNYNKTEYFIFLYELGFKSDKYWELAKCLHNIDYIWYNKMDENRMYDGIEIRKYYLSDELGYMPDDIDEYDDYIFPPEPSVLEVLVGFSNRLCRDILNWRVDKLMSIWMRNLKLDKLCNKSVVFVGEVEETIEKWMNGDLSIFGDEVRKTTDLWSQAAEWMQCL
jgi:hypothetical protein